jgi:hypothetical protein
MAVASRFALQLESLYERIVPSVTVVQDGSTLTINGDQSANDVHITDDGTAAGLTVIVDGQDYPLTGSVDTVRVLTHSGRDTVNYSVTGDYVGTTRTVEVLLGNGDDTFAADLGHGIDVDSSLTLRASGQNGKDNLSVTGPAAGDAAILAGRLNVELNGGNGKDVLSFTFAGEVDGSLDFSADGGNGKDNISGDVAAAADSTGSVKAHVLGGNGKDDLNLSVTGDGLDGLSDLDASIDGGHGKDSIQATDNVTILDGGKK